MKYDRAENEPGCHPEAEAEKHFDERHPRVGEEAVGRMHNPRLHDAVKGRQDVLRLAGHDDEELPYHDD